MTANLLKKYRKQFLLLLFLSLNICVSFTPKGISVGVQQLYAQEGVLNTGIDWIDNALYQYGYSPGVYVNDGSGNFYYCNDCAAQVNLDEITVYGTDLSNTPVSTTISDLWNSTPTSTSTASWEYWDYAGEAWQQVNTGTNESTQPQPVSYLELTPPVITCGAEAGYQAGSNYTGAACNIGVRTAFGAITGLKDLYPTSMGGKVSGLGLADDIYGYLASSDEFYEIDAGSQGGYACLCAVMQNLANEGRIVIGAYYNANGEGHVNMVVPGTLMSSGTYGYSVPHVMSTGAYKKSADKSLAEDVKCVDFPSYRWFVFQGNVTDSNCR